MVMHPGLSGLYAITPGGLPTEMLLNRVEAALRGGAAIVQYRDKSSDPALRWRQATRLQALCATRQALFIINDDVDLARAIQADGVHLGRKDGSLRRARATLGDQAIIGASCYNRLDLAQAAAAAGADYVAFGACFPSSTKPDAVRAELKLFAQAAHVTGLPTVAIGGINPDNAHQVIEAGASMTAVIQGLFQQADIESAARHIAQLFNSNRGLP